MITKKIVLALAGGVVSLTAFNAMALSNVHTAQINSTQTQYNTQLSKSTASPSIIVIEDHAITLSQSDQTKARNFDLTDSEYAKFKYIMEYTPRGNWTPKIDPVLALGITANTEKERQRFAEKIFNQRKKREAKEIAFSLTMMGVERKNDPNSPRWMSWEQKKAFSLSNSKTLRDAALPPKPLETVSVFVNPVVCSHSKRCITAMNNAIIAKQTNTNLSFYAIDGDTTSTTMLRDRLTIPPEKTGVTFTQMAENKLAKDHPILPFILIQNGKGDTVVRL